MEWKMKKYLDENGVKMINGWREEDFIDDYIHDFTDEAIKMRDWNIRDNYEPVNYQDAVRALNSIKHYALNTREEVPVKYKNIFKNIFWDLI